jgi:hypothetical protein
MRQTNPREFNYIEGRRATDGAQSRNINVERQATRVGDPEPAHELPPLSDEIEIDSEELDDIGDLGNEQDAALDLDALIETLDARPPTRFAYFVQRAAECIKALRAMRGAQASPWPQDRVPEAHWRALADDALGLIGDAVKQEIDRESLVASLPEAERQGLQRLLDSSLGLQIFRRAFDQERAAWEKTFWLMALDQSFGKRPWTGPQGWREWKEPPSARQGAAQK